MAASMGLTFAANHLKQLYITDRRSQYVHVLASGLKVLTTAAAAAAKKETVPLFLFINQKCSNIRNVMLRPIRLG